MKELKKLSKKDLILLRSVKQFGHQIGFMINTILRQYDTKERYKCRFNLKTVLGNIDDRFVLLSTRLNRDGVIVEFYNSLPLYMAKCYGNISIRYIDESISETLFRWMNDFDMHYVINMLHKFRKRLIDIYKFNKNDLPKFKGNDHTVAVYKKDGNINYLDSEYHQKDFDKYLKIYNSLIGSPLLQSFYPNIKFEEGVMKFYSGNTLLYYVDPKEKMIVSLDAHNQFSTGYILRPKELNRLVRSIDKLIDGGIM